MAPRSMKLTQLQYRLNVTRISLPLTLSWVAVRDKEKEAGVMVEAI